MYSQTHRLHHGAVQWLTTVIGGCVTINIFDLTCCCHTHTTAIRWTFCHEAERQSSYFVIVMKHIWGQLIPGDHHDCD